MEELDNYISSVNNYSTSLSSVLELLLDIQKQFSQIESSSDELHIKCNNLINEKSRLEQLIESILTPLSYYEDIDNLCDAFGIKFDGMNPIDKKETQYPQSDIFMASLNRLEDCIKYISEHVLLLFDVAQ